MEKKPIDELVDNIHEAFKLVPAIDAIVKCNSVLALEHLHKVIDERIKNIKVKMEG